MRKEIEEEMGMKSVWDPERYLSGEDQRMKISTFLEIKVVNNSRPFLHMSCLHKIWCSEMNALIVDFWWRYSSTCIKKIHLMQWKTITNSKRVGEQVTQAVQCHPSIQNEGCLYKLIWLHNREGKNVIVQSVYHRIWLTNKAETNGGGEERGWEKLWPEV